MAHTRLDRPPKVNVARGANACYATRAGMGAYRFVGGGIGGDVTAQRMFGTLTYDVTLLCLWQ